MVVGKADLAVADAVAHLDVRVAQLANTQMRRLVLQTLAVAVAEQILKISTLHWVALE
jgi:hypothetical protein